MRAVRAGSIHSLVRRPSNRGESNTVGSDDGRQESGALVNVDGIQGENVVPLTGEPKPHTPHCYDRFRRHRPQNRVVACEAVLSQALSRPPSQVPPGPQQ